MSASVSTRVKEGEMARSVSLGVRVREGRSVSVRVEEGERSVSWSGSVKEQHPTAAVSRREHCGKKAK